MPTNRKRIVRKRKDTGLTGAQEMFVYGKTCKPVNCFEMWELQYPGCNEKVKAKVELLLTLKASINKT